MQQTADVVVVVGIRIGLVAWDCCGNGKTESFSECQGCDQSYKDVDEDLGAWCSNWLVAGIIAC